MKSTGRYAPKKAEVQDTYLVSVVAALWALTSGLAIALYTRVTGDHRKLEERVGYLEQSAALVRDIDEIKQLIRDNTAQTNEMRREARETVKNAHARIDETNRAIHETKVEIAGLKRDV